MTSLLRFGAISGVFAGLLTALPAAIEAATGETVATSFALGIAPALGLPLVVALHLGQSHAGGRLASAGYATNLIGLGLFGGAGFTLNLVLVHVDAAVVEGLPGLVTLVLLGSALVSSVGVVLFGISMVRARVYPRIPSLGYAVVFPMIALLAPLPDTLAISAIHVLVGAVLVWLSTALFTVARVEAPSRMAVA